MLDSSYAVAREALVGSFPGQFAIVCGDKPRYVFLPCPPVSCLRTSRVAAGTRPRLRPGVVPSARFCGSRDKELRHLLTRQRGSHNRNPDSIELAAEIERLAVHQQTFNDRGIHGEG